MRGRGGRTIEKTKGRAKRRGQIGEHASEDEQADEREKTSERMKEENEWPDGCKDEYEKERHTWRKGGRARG